MSQTTFWNLLKENKIEIPIIQRDYAQGREGKEYLRQTFLESLKIALDESLKLDENQYESSGKNKVLKLDFVYGSAENGAMQPLDGQQRLTTLWLLHWYIAMRAGKLHEAGDTLKKFTYETRISSREFCEELCKAENFESFDGNNIVSYITSQTWFYSSWKQDPTIQSMLRMLGGTQIKGKSGNDIPDGIEEVFKDKKKEDFSKYWEKLKSDNAPIVFYYLPLKDFGLSDDLYIKMNARGKQLTNFENFKADLVGYIQEKAEEENKKWKNLASSVNGIPAKLDTEWTDIFWQNKTDDGRIDEIYFAFLNRYFLHYAIANLDANENSPIWKLYGDKSDDSALSYDNGFQMYADTIEKKLQVETSQEQNTSEKNLLEKLSALYANVKQIVDKVVKDQTCNDIKSINDKIRSYLPAWFALFDFIPQYKKNDDGEYEVGKDSFGNNLYKVTTLNQSPRVVFFGICRYLEESGSFDERQFKRWMRVVCNLTENIPVTMRIRIRIKLINILSSHCTDIYSFLSKLSDNEAKIESDAEKSDLFRFLSEIKSDAAKEQLAEEIAKAKQILKGNYDGNLAELKGKTWEDVIIEAENYAFFKGAIRFLFRNEKGEWDWKDFDTKWENAQRYFDKENGLYKIDSNLLRFFISQFNIENEDTNWSLFWEMVYDNEDSSWRNLLIKEKWKRPIHETLISNNTKINTDYQSTFKNEKRKSVQEDFVKMNLLECIASGCTLKYIKDNYLLTPYKSQVEWEKYIIGNHRNRILSFLYGGKSYEQSYMYEKIYTDQKIDGCDFFWGWDIYFKYKMPSKTYDFTWYRDDSIYILNEGKSVKDKDGKDIKFSGESITDKNSLIQSLNDCIEKYEKLQSEQPTS